MIVGRLNANSLGEKRQLLYLHKMFTGLKLNFEQNEWTWLDFHFSLNSFHCLTLIQVFWSYVAFLHLFEAVIAKLPWNAVWICIQIKKRFDVFDTKCHCVTAEHDKTLNIENKVWKTAKNWKCFHQIKTQLKSEQWIDFKMHLLVTCKQLITMFSK